MFLQI